MISEMAIVHIIFIPVCPPSSQAEEADDGVWSDHTLHPVHLLCHPLPQTGFCPGTGMSPLSPLLLSHAVLGVCCIYYSYCKTVCVSPPTGWVHSDDGDGVGGLRCSDPHCPLHLCHCHQLHCGGRRRLLYPLYDMHSVTPL